MKTHLNLASARRTRLMLHGTAIMVMATSLCLLHTRAQAGVYEWTNFAGLPGGQGNVDGTGAAARFNQPYGVAVDASGDVSVTDQQNECIRKITAAGEREPVSALTAHFHFRSTALDPEPNAHRP